LRPGRKAWAVLSFILSGSRKNERTTSKKGEVMSQKKMPFDAGLLGNLVGPDFYCARLRLPLNNNF
jgi:hypothetical protein